MIQNDEKNKLDEVLKEIHKVLDSITAENLHAEDSKKNADFCSEDKKENKEISQESISSVKKEYTTEIVTSNIQQQGLLLINTALFYHSSISDAKEIFFNNINSTLKKVSKKPIELIPKLCLVYEDFNKDLLLKYNEILQQIKLLNINACFLVVNDKTQIEDDFIKKLSSFVCVAKSFNNKELNMRSTYLDISIDLLLVFK